jgi:hypothetical protein
MTELVARIQTGGAGVRMHGMFERTTWPLRRLAWWIEEKVYWPLADAIRGRGEHAAPIEFEAERPSRRPDLRIALATVGGAAVIGIGVAALIVSTGGGSSATTALPSGPAIAAGTPPPASVGPQAAGADPSKLQGVTPNFKAAAKATPPQASSKSQADAAAVQTSPLQGTNSKPSSIPAGVTNDAGALRTAKDFAGAFVLYEVGRSSAKVKQTFAQTATPALVKALKARPPRQPDSVKVPKAKVQNVVLSAPQGNGKQIEASVSLLRLGALSELRLSLIQREGTWAVNEVRG